MNLLIISGEFPPFAGGAGTYCNYLVKALSKRGHSVTLLTKDYKEKRDLQSQIDEDLAKQNVKCIRMQYSKFTFIFSWYRTILNFLKHNTDFDFVIFNGNIVPLVCCKAALKKFLKKYITIQHGLSAYDTLNRNRFVALFYKRQMLDNFFKNAVANIAISQNLKEKLEQSVKMPNLHVILNCIDNKIFTFPTRTDDNNTLQLTTASRLIPAKNTIAVVRLFAKLRNDFPNLYLNIAGSGSELDRLKEEAKDLQIAPLVNFTGQLNAQDLCGLYQKSDVFILLSFYENLALVYLEANACGVPVIGSDVGGTREAIDDKTTGFVVSLDNENEIYEKTKLLLGDKALRDKMGQSGKKRVDENFSLDTLGKNFEKLLTKLQRTH
ncbi:MAG: glycosyltransferase family 4 protein [Spirochaetota bacterium]|nr:glycosyltransferase family 4 protein [Spirochaetota bacterium]